MMWKNVCAGLMSFGMLLGCSSVMYAGDIMEQAQQMYDDAYAQTQQEYNEAFDQAQSEFNAAYDQAKEDVNEALGNSSSDSGETDPPVTSPIKDYVGKNLATFGYSSLGGDYLDNSYAGSLDTLTLTVLSDDGAYVDYEDKDVLKNYVVKAQSIEPGSDLTFTYDDMGFVAYRTYDEIVLLVEKVGEKTENPIRTELTAIKPATTQEVQYIKDYIGRNLATVGYTGMDGDWHDEYNGTFQTVELVVNSSDGTYLDPEDKETLKQYVVIAQSPAPNSEETFVYGDYGFVDSQTYNQIDLTVAKIDSLDPSTFPLDAAAKGAEVADAPEEAVQPEATAEDSAPSEGSSFEVLTNGSKGDIVAEIQKKLIEKGFLDGNADGSFGPKTQNAVIAFQNENSMDPTGTVDENTYNAIMGS